MGLNRLRPETEYRVSYAVVSEATLITDKSTRADESIEYAVAKAA